MMLDDYGNTLTRTDITDVPPALDGFERIAAAADDAMKYVLASDISRDTSEEQLLRMVQEGSL